MANLFSGVAPHFARDFEVPPADCDCRCHGEVGGSGEAAAAGDAPGLKLPFDTCLRTLSEQGGAVPAPAPTPCPTGRGPVCAQLPLGAWLALGGVLLVVGYFLGWAARGCCAPGRRPRAPAAAHLRLGAFVGPASPLAFRAAVSDA